MTDRDFDRALELSAGSLPPPPKTVRQINPWSGAIRLVLWGLALQHLTINNLGLQYLLPLLGAALCFLGFRTLRRENPGFRRCWACALGLMGCAAAGLLVLSTPLNLIPAVTYGVGTLKLLLLCALFLGLRAGLWETLEAAGQPRPKGEPLLWAVALELVFPLMAFSPLSHTWLAFFLMLGWFLAVLRAVKKAVRPLDDAGYRLKAAPVRLRPALLLVCWAALLLALWAGCCLTANRLDTPWLPAETAAGEQETRQALLAQGFPEDLLRQLPDGEVAKLRDAAGCQSEWVWQRLPVREGDTEATAHGRLLLRQVKVQLESGRARLYTGFVWTEDAASSWQEALQLYDWADQFVYRREDVSAGVTCSLKGQALAAALEPRLERAEVESQFFPPSERLSLLLRFTFPRGAVDRQGWAAYTICYNISPGHYYNVNFWADYYHQLRPWTLPWRDAGALLGSGAAPREGAVECGAMIQLY